MPARHDAPGAPHDDLLHMRRGTAFFARVLADLSDDDIARTPQRRMIIAEVSLWARKTALWVKSHREALSDEETNFEVDVPYTATLPIPALRHLFTHSALHLNVELRDLDDLHWAPVADIPNQRAEEIWKAGSRLKEPAAAKDV
ncbi:hypothetical protein [Phaeobacter sp. C3_T13_0]|uniref:hypothetical protein n=1 Tax=Phaeobacter cretensis TaxID=3342641 RepID=UPI0039BD51A3